jgi:hypothetical protein
LQRLETVAQQRLGVVGDDDDTDRRVWLVHSVADCSAKGGAMQTREALTLETCIRTEILTLF